MEDDRGDWGTAGQGPDFGVARVWPGAANVHVRHWGLEPSAIALI